MEVNRADFLKAGGLTLGGVSALPHLETKGAEALTSVVRVQAEDLVALNGGKINKVSDQNAGNGWALRFSARGTAIGEKEQWFRDFRTYFKNAPEAARVKGIAYFHNDADGALWEIDKPPEALSPYHSRWRTTRPSRSRCLPGASAQNYRIGYAGVRTAEHPFDKRVALFCSRRRLLCPR